MSYIIEEIAVSDLRPWARNARTHSKKQLRQIGESIRTFGFTNPVLIDAANTILAGHGRVEAAKLIGMSHVPCVRLEHMTPDQKRAYVLADNKLALNAGWDEDLLAEELQVSLMDMDDLDFGLERDRVLELAEIDNLIRCGGTRSRKRVILETMTCCRAMMFQAQSASLATSGSSGAHRLICGNALDPEVVVIDADGRRAGAYGLFTDPPYNAPIDGHVGGKGRIRHREFAMAAGEMTVDRVHRRS